MLGGGIGGPFGIQIGGQRGEEPARDRNLPLMPTLAAGDEHPPRSSLQIAKPQPEDLAAAQPTQHHRLDHRPIPMRAQRGQQGIDLTRFQDPRQGPPGAYQRHPLAGPLAFPPGRQPPRDRVAGHVPADVQEPEQPRDA